MVGCMGNLSMSLSALHSDSSITSHLTAFTRVGSVHSAQRPAAYLRCNACILTTLYKYYPVCDAMRATCTLVSCHIWWHHI